MNRHRMASLLLVLSLFLTGILLAAVPGSAGNVERWVELEDGEHWVHEMRRPPEPEDDAEGDGDWRYEILAWEVDGKSFDLYILTEGNLEYYLEGEDFTAVLSFENVNSTGFFNWTTEWHDPVHYLVLDNKDNIHEEDAHQGGTITVDIRVEREEFDWMILLFVFVGVCCAFPTLLIVVLLGWVFLEPRVFPQSKSSAYRNLTRSPCFQPAPVNPKLDPDFSPRPQYYPSPGHSPEQYPPEGYQETTRGQHMAREERISHQYHHKEDWK